MTNETQNKRKYGLGEICQETMNVTRNSAACKFLEGMVKGLTVPFRIPTIRRQITEADEDTEVCVGEIVGFATGLVPLVMAGVGEVINYSVGQKNDLGEILPYLAIANLVSWGYEQYYQAKKNLNEKYKETK